MQFAHFLVPPESPMSGPSAGPADHMPVIIPSSATGGSAKSCDSRINRANTLDGHVIPDSDQSDVSGYPQFPQGEGGRGGAGGADRWGWVGQQETQR